MLQKVVNHTTLISDFPSFIKDYMRKAAHIASRNAQFR